jgi:hypothetical protein
MLLEPLTNLVKEIHFFGEMSGELDIQIEDVAEKGPADLRLKAKPAVIKKAS